MTPFDWLVSRPIAHRGLHDAASGVIENTPSAFRAAVAARYSIECDLQVTADGEAIVHHDFALGRLTEGKGVLAQMSADALKRVAFTGTTDRMITLGELCDLVAGRVPLVLEIKSRFEGERRLVDRVATVLSRYQGPVAAMSFDPEQVRMLRERAPALARGIVAERWYRDPEWGERTWLQKQAMAHLLHAFRTAPHFVAYRVGDLPTAATSIARSIFRCPLLAWTVRTAEERARAQRHASQMIFEGFRP
ncbi:MAG TPA: glycerophosphodiester phosphodiesterase family protein [Xanthobacteraceae bacterium]|nr:glycerophosphodiester phosphodiesterase family protein [Xanthobacteraceae bacterium]